MLEALETTGIRCIKGYAFMYLEDARLLLSRIFKYLYRKKHKGELILEAIRLKDKIRRSNDETIRRDADIRIQEIIKELKSEEK